MDHCLLRNSVVERREIRRDQRLDLAAVIERELDELGEHRLFDHEQRAGGAAQPVFVGGRARIAVRRFPPGSPVDAKEE